MDGRGRSRRFCPTDSKYKLSPFPLTHLSKISPAVLEAFSPRMNGRDMECPPQADFRFPSAELVAKPQRGRHPGLQGLGAPPGRQLLSIPGGERPSEARSHLLFEISFQERFKLFPVRSKLRTSQSGGILLRQPPSPRLRSPRGFVGLEPPHSIYAYP